MVSRVILWLLSSRSSIRKDRQGNERVILYERGKTAKRLLECEQSVIELTMRGNKVDQHW
jgi:hypothetical protein